jgi:hypothetical protein
MRGATPASATRGQAPQLNDVLTYLLQRQQQLRALGLQQQPVPRPGAAGGGLLGM